MEGSAERDNMIYKFDKQYIDDLKREKNLKSFSLKDYLPHSLKKDALRARNNSLLTTQTLPSQSTILQTSAYETATFKALQKHYTQDKTGSALESRNASKNMMLPLFHSLNSTSSHVS
jgi:hypothetical protein